MEFPSPRLQERKLVMRSQPEQALECPRCASTNTKFCYYNNYSLSQPRYFCKGCRRYWTHGGSLRNVPVGGGCRKAKKPSSITTAAAPSSFSTISSSSKKAQDYHQQNHHHRHHQDLTINHSNPLPAATLIPSLLPYDSNDDLTFTAFPRLHRQSLPMEAEDNRSSNPSLHLNSTVQATAAAVPPPNGDGFLDILSSAGFGGHTYSYGMATSGGVGAGGGGGGLLSLEGAAGLLAGSGAAGSTAAAGHGLSCKAMDGVLDNKVVSGLPWQDASMDSAKESWNGGVLGSSSLQGLINSSLLCNIVSRRPLIETKRWAVEFPKNSLYDCSSHA